MKLTVLKPRYKKKGKELQDSLKGRWLRSRPPKEIETVEAQRTQREQEHLPLCLCGSLHLFHR